MSAGPRGGESARSDEPADLSVGPWDVAAFLCELAMLALLAWSGWALGDVVVLSILLLLLLPGVAIAVWARWCARTSATRLPRPQRLGVEIALFVVVGLVTAVAGAPWWGLAFAVVASGVFALASDA